MNSANHCQNARLSPLKAVGAHSEQERWREQGFIWAKCVPEAKHLLPGFKGLSEQLICRKSVSVPGESVWPLLVNTNVTIKLFFWMELASMEESYPSCLLHSKKPEMLLTCLKKKMEINLNLLKVLVLNEMPHRFIFQIESDHTFSKMHYS